MLYAIGEMLIDFVAAQKGREIKEVDSFVKAPGGAPANVAALVAKCGGVAAVITQLGKDPFGDFLLEELERSGVSTNYIFRTSKANTGLAFVSVKENGERDFSFYRNPSADLLLEPSAIKEEWFNEEDFLHFCSVDLVESPMKEAHRQAISFMEQKGGLISFDPNVRLSLWEKPELCRQAILEFLPKAHILKISDEELAFITGDSNEEKALQSLFQGNVQAILYTKGASGAELLTKEGVVSRSGYPIEVEDTTGAGDAFMGGFLYQLAAHGVTAPQLSDYAMKHAVELLDFANACGAMTAMKRGAISAMPNLEEVEIFMKERGR